MALLSSKRAGSDPGRPLRSPSGRQAEPESQEQSEGCVRGVKAHKQKEGLEYSVRENGELGQLSEEGRVWGLSFSKVKKGPGS